MPWLIAAISARISWRRTITSWRILGIARQRAKPTPQMATMMVMASVFTKPFVSRRDRCPQVYGSLAPEKIQHSESYGLPFRPIEPKFAQEVFLGCYGTPEAEKSQPAQQRSSRQETLG